MKVIEAPAGQWPDIGFGESRKIGYKTRDIQVAKMCCKIFNIVAKPCMLDEVPKWEQECYHCKTKDHQRSGGCFTVKQGKFNGCETETVEVD